MASEKRPAHFVGHDRDGEDAGNTSKRRQGDSVPTQIGTRGENKLVEKIFVPMIRRAVGEEVTSVIGRLFHPYPRQRQRQRTLQLRFKESPGKTYTGVEVEAKNGDSLEVALYQCDVAGVEERIVTEGALSSIEIELCVLQGSFGSGGREDWSSEDFRRSILNQTRNGGKLLTFTGDLSLRLTNGVVTVKNLCINDISKCDKTGHFRLGARVAESTPETENIREAISQPFKVRHSRGMGNQKHDTPSLNDEIWRLEGIARDGKTHELLQSKGINTVGAFLHRLNNDDSNQLKQDLSKVGVREKKWEKLVEQAKKACAKQDDRKQYLPTAPLVLEAQLQQLVQTGQGLPQHELSPYAPQSLSVASTEEDVDFKALAEYLAISSPHEGHSVHMSSRGGCTTIWSQIAGAFKVIPTWRHPSRVKRGAPLPNKNAMF